VGNAQSTKVGGHEEPYESRGSLTDPRGPGGEIPLGYSTSHNKKPLFRMLYNSIPLVSEM
jgi:hypothetical protein